MTLAGYEGWVAVKEGAFWALYFDWDGDRLQSKVGDGTPVVDIDLVRRETRFKRPPRQPQAEQPEGPPVEGQGQEQQPATEAQT